MTRSAARAAMAVAAITGLLAAAPVAGAEVMVVRAKGDAPTRPDGDPRNAAIDSAFANAVGQAVTAVVSTRDRDTYRVPINDRIVKRARLYVAEFTVDDEGDDDGRYVVEVSARVDMDKLRGALTAVGVPLGSNGSGDNQGSGYVAPRARAPLTVIASMEGVDGGGLAAAVGRELDRWDFEVIDVGARRTAAGPIDDRVAIEVARRAGAGGVVVIAGAASSDGRVRGTHLTGVAWRAGVRVLDVAAGTTVVDVELDGASFGASGDEAIAATAGSVARRVGELAMGRMVAYWPPATETIDLGSDAGVLVEVHGASSWRTIAALQSTLSGVPGVRSVLPLRIGPRQIILRVVTTTSADRIRRAAAATPITTGTLRTQQTRDGRVRVDELGAPQVGG